MVRLIAWAAAFAALSVCTWAGPTSDRLAATFEVNQGQVDDAVRFFSRRVGGTLFLTPNEAVLQLKDGVLRMRLEGAEEPKVQGVARMPGTVSYFRGGDAPLRLSAIPTFERVRYEGVYSGIDLVFYGNGEGRFEYDFVVAPGADPSAVALRLEGAEELRLDAHGSLVARLGDGTVVQPPPVLYQISENGERESVEGSYSLSGERLRFRVGEYDRARELVIDPVLVFSSLIGGDGRDSARGVAVGPDGSVYVAGETTSNDFPTVNPLQAARTDTQTDLFVMRLDPTGTQVIFATYLGGSSGDVGGDIEVAADNSVYVVGEAGSGFPVTAGAFQTDGGGSRDAFIARISADGSTLTASTLFGGRGGEEITAVDLDAQGYVYVAGNTSSRDLPTTPGSFQPTRGTPDNTDGIFVAKLMPDLTSLVYSTHIDSGDDEDVRDIEVHDGYAFITGSAESDLFPTTPGVVQPTKNGAPRDGFVAKLSRDGSSLVFSTFIGGDNFDSPVGIDVDPTGHAYVTGNFTGFNTPTTAGAFRTERNDNDGGMVMKLSPTGDALLYSTYTGSGADRPHSIRVDSQGAAHIAGVTTNRVLEVTPDALQPANLNRSTMAYYMVFSHDGTRQLYSSYHGGDDLDAVGEFQGFLFGDVLDEIDCQAVFVGRTLSPNFPLQDAFQSTAGGGDWDAFVSRVDPFTPDGEPHLACSGVTLATGTPVIRKLAPRSIGTAFGSDFSSQTVLAAETDGAGFVTSDLGGSCIEIADQRAAEFAVLPTQINFMVPPDTPLGWQRMRVVRDCNTANEVRSEPQLVLIEPVAPAFFNFINNADGVNPIAAIDNATGSLIGPSGLFGAALETEQGVVTTPAQPGQIVVVFPTGMGPTSPALANGQIPGGAFNATGDVRLTLGGVEVPSADVFYAGAAPCCAGLDQITFRVPEGLSAGNHPLVVTVDGAASPEGPFIAVAP